MQSTAENADCCGKCESALRDPKRTVIQYSMAKCFYVQLIVAVAGSFSSLMMLMWDDALL